MRVLFLSNFYPPVSRGGYEEWCQEVAEGLRSRGHNIAVLTSRHGRSTLPYPEPSWIHRDLQLEMEFASFRNSLQFFTSRKDRENENLFRLQLLVEEFEPDAILVWGMWNLPRSLPAKAEELMPGQVVYYMGDYWPTLPSQWQNYWQVPPRNWVTAAPKLLLKPVANHQLAQETRPSLCFERVIFPTVFLKEEFTRRGIEPRESTIIYGAIDTSLYGDQNGASKKKLDNMITLLYVGRLSAEKGVHTAIMALSHLVHQKKLAHLQLMIVGSGEPEYEAYLSDLVKQEQLDSKVTFLGIQPKESIPQLYQHADIFLFTSIWPEPFGRVIVEAMASGLPVIGSPIGGAAEIMIKEENALLFTPDDAEDLACRIEELVETPHLRRQLSEAGRQTALTKFDMQSMVDEIETYLHSKLAN